MINKVKIFSLSYPKSESKQEIRISSALVGVAAYLFLLVFQPFGTNTISVRKLIGILLPYPVLVASVFYFVNIALLSKTGKWNVGKEISKITGIVFLCSVLGYFYNTLWVSKVNISILNLLYMFLYTFSIAVPVCSVYLSVRFIYLNDRNKKPASALSGEIKIERRQTQNTTQNHIRINDNEINENDLFLIESTDNYCTFHYGTNTGMKKALVRTTLKSAMGQIKSKHILRCHRSCVVNLKKVKNIKGNAQGYKLYLENTGIEVPVSRKYIDEVKNILGNS
ncbi:MAG: LytTR family transcriptional regulator DNA-binding domain-containing protein [Breznakibacter sp.]